MGHSQVWDIGERGRVLGSYHFSNLNGCVIVFDGSKSWVWGPDPEKGSKGRSSCDVLPHESPLQERDDMGSLPEGIPVGKSERESHAWDELFVKWGTAKAGRHCLDTNKWRDTQGMAAYPVGSIADRKASIQVFVTVSLDIAVSVICLA